MTSTQAAPASTRQRLAPWVAAGIVVALAGIVLGGSLVRSGIVETVANRGDLLEVHLSTGVILVGRFQESSEGFLRLSLAANITSGPVATDDEPQFVVQLLNVDPYDLAGEVLVAHEQVLLAGPVAVGSSLARAYQQALGEPVSTPVP